MHTVQVKIRAKPDRNNYQLYYVDPLTGADVTKTSGTGNVREAERAAAKWEAELEEHGTVSQMMSWEQFRLYYEDTHLVVKSPKTQSVVNTALNWLEKSIGKPKRVDMIDSLVISRLVADWRKRNMKGATIAAYLRSIRAVLYWAHKMRLIRQRPVFAMPGGSGRFMRGRPITKPEFRQLLRACRIVRPADWRQWVRFLCGLWYSGLRLEEAVRLSWAEPPLRIDLDGAKYPRLVIHAAGQKARRDELTPLAPDFATWLRRTPAGDRRGLVLPLYWATGDGRRIASAERIGLIVADIGRASGLVVNDEGKHVSAHDLRRSFGTRWAAKVKPLTLKRLMRHTSIETTLRYYVDQDADDVAEELWAGGSTGDKAP